MSIESDIAAQTAAFAGLSALIGTRMYPDLSQQEGTQPYVVFQEVSIVETHQAMGAGTIRQKLRYQFDAYADTKLNVIAVKDQMELAFNKPNGFGSTVIAMWLESGDQGITEPDEVGQLFRCRRDFMVWK